MFLIYTANTKLAEEVWQYDAADRPTKLTYTSSGCNVEENITYTTEADSAAPTNRISSYTYTVANKGCASIENTYDKFHRVTAKAVTVGGNQVNKSYSYDKTRLSGVSHTVNGSLKHTYNLGYDVLSRITSETDSKISDYNNTYVYDSYGQLIRENNKRLNKTILYTYDNIGNTTRVQKYDYTTDDEVSGTSIEDIYTYDSTYPDCLKTFNGKSITYDANGRVATYDGWEYTWEREQLKSIEQTNSTDDVPPKYTFTYNAYGERTTKVYTNVKSLTEQSNYLTNSTTNYKYDLCGRLISENRTLQYSKTASTTKELTYLYDNSEIVGFVLTDANGTNTYYYDKNIFGDVISILDNTGNPVVKYKYDAYGNCTVYDSVNTDLAETNPIRYRSYYYDVETGLYYLQTRYYNPEWRRFISPDSTSYLDPENPTGLNLCCYCGNDPVNYVDPTGHFAISTFLISMAVSSLVTWGLSKLFGVQIADGIGSISGGSTAVSTGISLCAFGLWGIVAGVALIGIGAATIVFGTNEIVDSLTGVNCIQSWIGMEDNLYNGIYIGLNIASSVGSIAGNIGMRIASNNILNGIIKTPENAQNYKLWQLKTYGRYSSRYIPGTLRKGGHIGQGYTLTNVNGGPSGYIQWHPGSGHHFNGLPYLKVTSALGGTWRGLYLF